MPLATLDISALEQIVLGKCDSFVSMSVWPSGEKFRPRKWLTNFLPEEKEHALYLLNAFTYYNLDISVALLKGSILSLSNISSSDTITEYLTKWDAFLKDAVFIPVTGEVRSITDSGNILAGNLRRDLLIPERDILTVDQLFDSMFNVFLRAKKHVIFFDDFVGSGQQFLTMWKDAFLKENISHSSVQQMCNNLGLIPHYCAMIGTEYGVGRIRSMASDVDLNFAHILPASVSPLHQETNVWPDHLKASGPDFILNATRRAGVPESKLRGFHNLGLTLAFSFTIPDATLPLFSWNKNNWSPIMEKT